MTDYAGKLLAEVRSDIAADDHVLSETRARRNLVKKVALGFEGTLKAFDSGSLAHGTINKPVSDGDCGVVLDRRSYPALGPDGEGVPPNDIVEQVADFVIEGVKEDYPAAEIQVGKRSIVISFNQPLADSDAEVEDQDPTVDLIVALTRAEGDGRWIPNTESSCWDASDPEEHTRLLSGPGDSERVHRARVIRMAKAAIKSDEVPVISSFNAEALALEHVVGDDPLPESLRDLLLEGAGSLEAGPTEDPAGVSDPLKLPDGVEPEQAVARLRQLGELVAEAIDNTEDEAQVRSALAQVFPDQLGDADGADSLASALSDGSGGGKVASAFGAGAGGLKSTAAFGGERENA